MAFTAPYESMVLSGRPTASTNSQTPLSSVFDSNRHIKKGKDTIKLRLCMDCTDCLDHQSQEIMTRSETAAMDPFLQQSNIASHLAFFG